MAKKKSKKKKKKDKKENIKKLGTFLSITALVLLVAGIFFVFGSRSSGNHDIELEIETTETINKGIPIELAMNINNRTSEPLENSELTVRLGNGLVNLDFQGERDVARINLNNIGEGTLTKETVRVLPVGDIGSEQEIIATLDYSIGSANFEKEFTKTITIENQPIEINIERPDQILGGSSFETVITYENTSDFDFPSLKLQAEYPSSFSFISSSLSPTSLNNTWDLGALKSGSKGEIKIRGTVENGNAEGSVIEAIVMAEFLEETYEVNRSEISLVPSESPLDVDVSLSGTPRAGNTLNYKIDYENKSGVALNNVTISSELAGEMFDLRSIQSSGKINSLGNQIVWDENTNSNLSVIEPSKKGSVNFSIKLKDNFPIRRLGDKNFEVVVNTEIESPTVPYYIDAERTSASETLRTKIQGLAEINASGFYRDANSGLLNQGSLPPRVGNKTQFTIHWAIKNHSTDIENVKISSTLPDGVSWTGQVKSNIDSVPLYEEGSKEVIWEIDQVTATRGLISDPVEAIFQVELSPRSQFVGSYHPLLLETTMEAIDSWTNVKLSDTDGVVNTSLPDDPTTSASNGIVE